MRVAAMHRIGARAKGFTFATSVWRVPGTFAVNDIGRDGQNRLRVNRVTIRWMLSQFAHEHRDHSRGELVHSIIVVSKHWKFAFGLVINNQPCLVADYFYARVTDGRQAVGYD